MTDAMTFDLAAYFAGTNYPEDSVTVYLDAALLQKRAKLSAAAMEAVSSQDDEKAAAITAELEKLNEVAEQSKFVIHIRGVDREVEQAILASVEKDHPLQRDFLGREVSNPEGDEILTTRLWQAKITKIEAPGGAVMVAPTEEQIKVFRAKAPKPALRAVHEAIQKLDAETAEGFSALVEDTGFLSTP